MSRILWFEPANKPQNLRAETEKLERVTCRSRQGERGFSQKWTGEVGVVKAIMTSTMKK